MGRNYNNNNGNQNNNQQNNNRSAKNYKVGADGKSYAAKSGAKFHHAGRSSKRGNTDTGDCITAWNLSKTRGFISLSAFPLTPAGLAKSNASLKEWCSKNGQKYEPQEFHAISKKSGKKSERWFAKVKFKSNGQTYKFKAYYLRGEGKLYVKGLDMVASVNARNGGCFVGL